MALIFEKYQ